jgi:O-antigen/teichoic acid export membrane protein
MNRSRVAIRSLIGSYMTLAVQMAVTLTVVSIAVKSLGENEYGRWVGLSSIAGWAALTDLGIGGMLTFHLSKLLEKRDLPQAAGILWHGLIISAVSGFVAFIVLGVVAVTAIWLQPDSFQLSRTPLLAAGLLAVSVPVTQLGTALAALQHARLRPLSSAAVSVVAALGSLAMSVALLPLLGATALAVGQFTRGVLMAGTLGVFNVRFLRNHLPSLAVNWEMFRPFLVTGFTGVANRWLQGILVTYDAFSVSLLCGPAQAAVYANTARPAGMATGLAAAGFGPAIMPLFSRFSTTRSVGEAQRVYVTCVRLVLAVCAALAIGFVFAYRPLITAWIGKEYVLPPQIVAVVAMAAVAQAWFGFATYLFGGSGHFLPANKLMLIEGLLRGSFMTAGVMIGGLFGLAVALAVTQAFAVIGCVGLLARVNGVAMPWKALVTVAAEAVAVASILALAAVYASNQLRLLEALLAGATGAVLLLSVFTLREATLRCFVMEAINQAIQR